MGETDGMNEIYLKLLAVRTDIGPYLHGYWMWRA